jgi:hypothetical protein
MKALQQSMRPCFQPRLKHVAVASPAAAAHARKLLLCRWAPDSRDEAVDSSTADSSSSRDPKQSRRLINQLLQIQSLSSRQSVDISTGEEPELTTAPFGEPSMQQEGQVLSTTLTSAVSDQQLPSSSTGASTSSTSSGSYTLFDDPASEDYDPLVLDML